MAYNSTAPIVRESDDEFIDALPVISDRVETSADVPEYESKTSGALTSPKMIRSRVTYMTSDPAATLAQRTRLQILRNWEGIVTEVNADSFFASMRLTNSKNERAEDEFEIGIENIADGDRELVKVGAVFYLTVGTRRLPGEGPEKVTRMIFRRMPRWTSRDIDRAQEEANELWERLHPENTRA